MEMYYHIHHSYNKHKFKIDLIVWKLNPPRPQSDCYRLFKIDLIVWKFCIASSMGNVALWFKIDLIVWKYAFSCSSDSIFKCLK